MVGYPLSCTLAFANPSSVFQLPSSFYRGTATILSKRSGYTDGPVSSAALRIVRQCAMQLIKRNGENYKTQEITNTIWSFATVGFGLKGGTTADAGNEYTFLRSEDIEGDRLLMDDTLKVAMNAAKRIVPRFRSQELNNLAWAMARLGQKDEELLTMMGNELAQPKRIFMSLQLRLSIILVLIVIFVASLRQIVSTQFPICYFMS